MFKYHSSFKVEVVGAVLISDYDSDDDSLRESLQELRNERID